MNQSITDNEERFKKATLLPIMGYTCGYTDTKQYINYAVNVDDGSNYVENQFGISIYHFNKQIRSLVTIMCNRSLLSNGYHTKISNLDVPDPRYNNVHIFEKQIKESKTPEIPYKFIGNELILPRQTKVHQFKSHYFHNDSFSEDNLIKHSKEAYNTTYRLSREDAGIVPYDASKLKLSIDIMDKKCILRSLLVDITKASIYSLFENFTIMYESGKLPSFKIVKPPFKQYVIDYMSSRMLFIYTEFSKLAEKICDFFGNVRIILHVNDVEHVIRAIFLDEPVGSLNRVLTLRITKLECVQEFISDTVNGRSREREEFMELHDIDALNFYAFEHKGDRYFYERNSR
jgi:hypothetical protein